MCESQYVRVTDRRDELQHEQQNLRPEKQKQTPRKHAPVMTPCSGALAPMSADTEATSENRTKISQKPKKHAPVMTPCSGVFAPTSADTAERENDPVVGYDENIPPTRLAAPIDKISCVTLIV